MTAIRSVAAPSAAAVASPRVAAPGPAAARVVGRPSRAGPAQAIAVVGAGLAGLTAAFRLSQKGHRVTVFERHAAAGFVAHAVAVPAGTAADSTVRAPTVRVDVPIRVFYAGYYPTLVRLYAELGVATEAVSYASSFHGEDGALYFRYRNWLTGPALGGGSYSWVAPGDLFGRHGARARHIVADALRFRRGAARALAKGDLGTTSLNDYVRSEGLGDDFLRGLLLPAIATICTCSYDDALRFPAAVIVDYLARGLTREPVRRAVLGADDVAQRLLAGAGTLRLRCALQSMHRLGPAHAGHAAEGGDGARGVELRLADGRSERFDHVVFATQANQALALLAEPSAAERAVLAAFTYRPIDVVMHRDERLLPARRADWSAVNLRVTPGQAQPQSTIWVNRVQPSLGAGGTAAPVFQTVHPLAAPRDDTVLAWAHFERPVVDAASERALAALAQLHAEPGRCVWFCGSYAQPGIPLLESAVRSAEVVASSLSAAVAVS